MPGPDILHLAPAPARRSGIATYAERYRRAVSQAGAEIRPLDHPPGALNSSRRVARYATAAVAASERVDVVHAELGGGSLAEFYAALAIARRGATALCLTLHEPPRTVWWPFQVEAVRRLRPLRAAVALATDRPAARLEHRLIARADGLATLAPSGALAVAEAHRRAIAPVAVLPFPVGPEPPPSAGYGGEHDGLRVGFFGHLYAGKGLQTLLDAIAQAAPGVQLTVWGEPIGDSARRPAPIPANGGPVRFAGHLPEDRVAATLAALDAVVVPYESPRTARALRSASAVAHEALAAGTPVVATTARALPDLVRDGDNGLLVAPGDAGALAHALGRLRDDEPLRQRLRGGAERTARELRSRSVGVEALELYARALARRGGG